MDAVRQGHDLLIKIQAAPSSLPGCNSHSEVKVKLGVAHQQPKVEKKAITNTYVQTIYFAIAGQSGLNLEIFKTFKNRGMTI